MGYTFFTVCAYVFMRAFEVVFSGQKNKTWYKRTLFVIGLFVMYAALAAMLFFYLGDVRFLGFTPK